MRSKGVSYKHRKGERVRCRGHAQRLGVHCMAPVSQGLCTSTYSVSFFRLKAFIIQTYSFLIIYNLPFCALLQDILTNYLSSWAILEVRARGVGSHAGWGGEKWAKEQRARATGRGASSEPCQEHTHEAKVLFRMLRWEHLSTSWGNPATARKFAWLVIKSWFSPARRIWAPTPSSCTESCLEDQHPALAWPLAPGWPLPLAGWQVKPLSLTFSICKTKTSD